MTTLTKQQVDEVIEKLVDKSLTFGCLVELLPSYGKCHSVKARLAWFESDNFQTDSNVIDSEEYFINSVIGHPILIGDVLFLDEQKASMAPTWGEQLLKMWPVEWRKQSLQEILESAKFEVLPCKEVHSNDRDCTNTEPVLKDEKVEALFQFLISLQLTK